MPGALSRLVLYGCGGHSRSVADIAIAENPMIMLTFVDEKAGENEEIMGFPVVRQYEIRDELVFVAVGDNGRRMRILAKLKNANVVSIVSSKAHVGWGARIGVNCFVGNYCHIGPEAVIGDNSIINNGAIVDHETRIGSHCHVAPNSSISGRCRIGSLVFVGAGASIVDGVTVCSNVTIGAGSTVIRDIDEQGVYVGSPARLLKNATGRCEKVRQVE